MPGPGKESKGIIDKLNASLDDFSNSIAELLVNNDDSLGTEQRNALNSLNRSVFIEVKKYEHALNRGGLKGVGALRESANELITLIDGLGIGATGSNPADVISGANAKIGAFPSDTVNNYIDEHKNSIDVKEYEAPFSQFTANLDAEVIKKRSVKRAREDDNTETQAHIKRQLVGEISTETLTRLVNMSQSDLDVEMKRYESEEKFTKKDIAELLDRVKDGKSEKRTAEGPAPGDAPTKVHVKEEERAAEEAALEGKTAEVQREVEAGDIPAAEQAPAKRQRGIADIKPEVWKPNLDLPPTIEPVVKPLIGGKAGRRRLYEGAPTGEPREAQPGTGEPVPEGGVAVGASDKVVTSEDITPDPMMSVSIKDDPGEKPTSKLQPPPGEPAKGLAPVASPPILIRENGKRKREVSLQDLVAARVLGLSREQASAAFQVANLEKASGVASQQLDKILGIKRVKPEAPKREVFKVNTSPYEFDPPTQTASALIMCPSQSIVPVHGQSFYGIPEW